MRVVNIDFSVVNTAVLGYVSNYRTLYRQK